MMKTYDPGTVEIWLGSTKLTGFADTPVIQHVDRGSDSWTAPAPAVIECTLVSSGVDRKHRDVADAMDYVFHNHATGRAISRHSGRGGSLIPETAFQERRWNRPTSPGHAPRDEEDADRERLQAGCYHKLPVRHEGGDE